tara:strand:+ start:204 stop:521 length:318 start_codon:yes stop_codon:yes gene_type:complete
MSDELTDILDTLDVPASRKKITRANVTWLLQHLRRLEVRATPSVSSDLTKAEIIEKIEELDPDASTSGKKSELLTTLAGLKLKTNGNPDRAALAKLLFQALKEAR